MPDHKDLTGSDLHVDASGLRYRDVQLNDAQIRALPTMRVEVVPAPGVGLIVVPTQAALIGYMPTTAYDNINGSALLIFGLNAGGGVVGISWSERATGAVSQVLHFPGSNSFAFGTPDKEPDVNEPNPQTNRADGADMSSMEDSSLVVYAVNTGGDFTGGHPDNTLSIRIWYIIVPAVPFGA